jgi:hypothetical protein
VAAHLVAGELGTDLDVIQTYGTLGLRQGRIRNSTALRGLLGYCID